MIREFLSSFGPGVMFITLVGLAPIIAALLAEWFDRLNRWRIEGATDEEKLPRPPGHSQTWRLEDEFGRTLSLLLTASICCSLAGFCVVGAGALASRVTWWWLLLVVGGAAALVGVMLLQRTLRSIDALRNCGLGVRNEQAVASILHELGDCGYRAFHDLPVTDEGNIDHVVVGAQGVFLIETSSQRKRVSRGDAASHVVRLEGRVLRFPAGEDNETIPRAERNARWLGDYLTEKTGARVVVVPLVVLPGWRVESRTPRAGPARVMNTRDLAGYLRKQPDQLPSSHVRRILAAVSEECLGVEL